MWTGAEKATNGSVQRRFRDTFHKNAPADKTICQWYQKFENTGCLCTPKRPGRPGSSEETVDQNMGGVIVEGRRIRFADDMALLAEKETILRDMLLELNDSCEPYGMKIIAKKTKIMIIGRKIKKVNLRILNEAVEQVDSFKYLGCTISSNMSCCQEVKRRIAMAKEAFNIKRSIFCGPLEKELRKRVVKCFVWSVAWYGT
ncbi:hypothetical protein ANN_17929 [Periplaneta americana]|uniref:Reverse transcriptase domain-containing protein n=1 Tax=Periplaneta americana TaxID=6978 RepID=A0ABQ8SNB2_PERAM|nr:hypothetical protein ANN_17929 [Periplaneta americana]